MPAQYGKKWAEGEALQDLQCPSGEICLVRRPGLQALMQAGVLGEIDSLTSIVDTKHVAPQKARKQGKKAADTTSDLAALSKDPDALAAVQRVTCKIMSAVVVRPTVRLHFRETGQMDAKGKPVYEDIPQEERDLSPSTEHPEDPVLFTDQIDFGDAMFIFQYAVGGTGDLASFRKQFDESLASVESLQNVPMPAK